MSQGLGIVGFIIVIFSIIIPLAGPYISFLALVIVALGALFGERTYAIATPIIAAANLFLFSPTWLITLSQSEEPDGSNPAMFFTIVFLALPFVGIVLETAGDKMSRRSKKRAAQRAKN